MTGNAPKLTRPPAGEREWFQAPSGASSIAPDVRLTHSKNKGTVEPVDLRRIADGMPAMLAEEGVTWSTLRTETRVRADGAHVGLIEGECTKTGAGLPGLATEARYRRLMFAFPDNDGMSIVVAVYGADEASRWQPVMESSITSARGVAKRFPPPPPWMRVAWGVAGSIVGYLVFALLTR